MTTFAIRCRCGITACRGALEITPADSHDQRTATVVSAHGTGHTIILDPSALTFLFAWLREALYPGEVELR